jgi:hypothetical protein
MAAHEPRVTSEWRTQMAEFRDRFDLDYDLGGYAASRTWGLANHRGWIAACFTLHPSDMPEYLTTSEERVTIIFSPPGQNEGADFDTTLPWVAPLISAHQIKNSRRQILDFVLNLDREQHFRSPWERKILYSAACCAVVNNRAADDLLALSKSAFQWLMRVTGADLTEEIARCSATTTTSTAQERVPGSAIPAKSVETIHGAGGGLFDACEICGEGFEWYSSEEVQCSQGHQFG